MENPQKPHSVLQDVATTASSSFAIGFSASTFADKTVLLEDGHVADDAEELIARYSLTRRAASECC